MISSQQPLKYADPTLHASFKLLFGTNDHKDIIKSILNSLFDFEGDDVIQDVQVINPEVSGAGLSDVLNKEIITSTVDMICTTSNGLKIAMEMQRHYKDYFLPRTQYYMASMVYGRIVSGEYDTYTKKNYMLILSDQNIFVEEEDLELFETMVTPRIHGREKTINGNRMFWKFYELDKFRRTANFQAKSINKFSPIKEQWLEFLCTCSQQTDVPDRDQIIVDAYKVMEYSKWPLPQRILYDDQMMMVNSERQRQETEKKNMYDKGLTGGEIKGAIRGWKKRLTKPGVKAKSLEEKTEMLVESYGIFEDPSFQDKHQMFLKYVEDHEDDSVSQIFEGLKSDTDMNIE